MLEILKILAALAALGQQFAFADDANFVNPEYLAASLLSGAADAGAVATWLRSSTPQAGATTLGEVWDNPITGEVWQSGGLKRCEKTARWRVDLILYALSVVEVLELFTGLGPPHEGEGVKTGAAGFDAVDTELGSATPGAHWQGSAAQTYVDQNAAQQFRAQSMADLDSRLAGDAQNMAHEVTHVRLGFGLDKGLLLAAYWYFQSHMGLWAYATVGRLALAVCLAGVTVALGMIGYQAYHSFVIADRVNGVASEYRTLAVGATGVA